MLGVALRFRLSCAPRGCATRRVRPGGTARASFDELDARAGDEIAHRPGRQDLARSGESGDARADVHGDPGEVVAANLALAGVQSGPHFQAEAARLHPDRLGTADRAGRPIEGGEKPVARGLHLAAERALDLAAHDNVVRVEQHAPAAIADLRRPLRRVDNVGEQHRLQHTFRRLRAALAGENSSTASISGASLPTALRWMSPGNSASPAPEMCEAR